MQSSRSQRWLRARVCRGTAGTQRERVPADVTRLLTRGASPQEESDQGRPDALRREWLFTGKELDWDTGYYYYGARYYDSHSANWLSPDPILASYVHGKPNSGVYAPGNLGLYTYAWNNPVKLVDTDGAIIDTFADVAFIALDILALAKDEAETGGANRAMNLTALTVDFGLLFVPFATGGGAAVRGGAHVLNAEKQATRGAIQSVRSSERVAIESAQQAEKAAVHGNSKASANEQHLYEIEVRNADGTVDTHKYGVSGGPVRTDGRSVRAENQVRELNATAKREGTGKTYSSRVIEKEAAAPGSRQRILDSEKKWVKQYMEMHGRRPEGNKRP